MRNIIAILRGIQPHEIDPIATELLSAGIVQIEIPLNSPQPYVSIARLVRGFAGGGIFGAGTVFDVSQVQELQAIGAQMVVSPHCDPGLIQATKAAGMLSYPGVMTPTECFQALEAGADGLKIFPAHLFGPSWAVALKSVLPESTHFIAVGSTQIECFPEWEKAGVTSFGIGSALYKAGDTATDVAYKAQKITQAYDAMLA